MGNVTITDIAREAGVSKATVSRVLNRSASVDSGTRERVEEIIRKKRYSPSTVARNLSYGTSSIVGIIVPEIDNPFFGELLRGASSIADKNDLTLMCFNSDDNAEKDYKADALYARHGLRYIGTEKNGDQADRGSGCSGDFDGQGAGGI